MVRLLLLLSVFLAGCNAGPERGQTLAPADSSREALLKFLHALEERDKEALLPLVDGGPEAQDFFASIAESAEVVEAFKQKLSETYGAEAWDAFQAPLPPDVRRPDMKLKVPGFAKIRTDAAAWEADGGNGGVFDGMPGIPLPFKEVSGGWVVDGSKVFPDEEALAVTTANQRKFTNFIARYMKAIGHPGISSEDIDYQMGKDFLIVMMGGEFKSDGKPATPDRFRIEDL